MKVPRWVAHVADGVVVGGLSYALWRQQKDGLTLLAVAEIAIMALCLTRLSYLVFPRGWFRRLIGRDK